MIQRLKLQNNTDVFEFIQKVNDRYEDFYLTKNKERHFLKNNWSLINKILRKYEVYGLFQNDLKAIMIIVREKNFRPYVKLLAENSKYTIDLLKFLKWNYFEKDLYFKLKKENPLTSMILKTGFIKIGNRGKELLFLKKGLKQLFKIIPKDNYLVDEEHKLY